mmetsp:Transcript_1109/g.1712  ORF Transcript_1109/g.1712 Transcript_1109/m.1712 type:complete len:941 (+) Transcript_1109:1-2823(+)
MNPMSVGTPSTPKTPSTPIDAAEKMFKEKKMASLQQKKVQGKAVNCLLPRSLNKSGIYKMPDAYSTPKQIQGRWNNVNDILNSLKSPYNLQATFTLSSDTALRIVVQRLDEAYEIGHMFSIYRNPGVYYRERMLCKKNDFVWETDIMDTTMDIVEDLCLKEGTYYILFSLHSFEKEYKRKSIPEIFASIRTETWGALENFELLPDFLSLDHRDQWTHSESGISFNNPQYLLKTTTTSNVIVKLSTNNKSEKDNMNIFVTKVGTWGKKRIMLGSQDNLLAQSPQTIQNEVTLSFKIKVDTPVIIVLATSAPQHTNYRIEIFFSSYLKEYNEPFVDLFEKLPLPIFSNKNEIDCIDLIKTFSDDKYLRMCHDNPVDAIIEKCKNEKAIFKDVIFTANEKSIQSTSYYNQSLLRSEKKRVDNWKRCAEFLDDPEIIVDGIDIQDMIQGELENGWLLQALAACAMTPHRIYSLFYPKTYNPYGVYSVKLFINEKWQYVLVDDYIPVREGKAIFAHSQDVHEMHVMLLEKAFAKIYGSYCALEQPHTMGEAFVRLTGGDTKTIFVSKMDEGVLWDLLKEYVIHEWLVGAKTLQKRVQYMGLVSKHAYSVMDVRDTKLGRLVKIRNTWGNTEWQGDFSDRSSSWTQEVKRELEVKDEDDGIFWMDYTSFLRNFEELCVCKVLSSDYKYSSRVQGTWKDNWYNNSLDTRLPKIPLKIKDNTRLLLTMTRAGDPLADKDAMKFIICRGRIKSERFKTKNVIVKSAFKNSRRLLLETSLTKGSYIIVPFVSTKSIESFTFNVKSDQEIEVGGKYKDPYPNQYKFSGNWDVCGGYMSIKNPILSFRALRKTELIIKFKRTDKKKKTGMVLFICKGRTIDNGHKEIDKRTIIYDTGYKTLKAFEPIIMTFTPSGTEKIHIVPCLQRKLAGAKYKLTLHAEHKLDMVVMKNE